MKMSDRTSATGFDCTTFCLQIENLMIFQFSLVSTWEKYWPQKDLFDEFLFAKHNIDIIDSFF